MSLVRPINTKCTTRKSGCIAKWFCAGLLGGLQHPSSLPGLLLRRKRLTKPVESLRRRWSRRVGFNLDHFGIERALPHTNVSANSGMGLHNVIYDPKEQRAIVDFLVREAIASESRISPQNAGCELANAFKRIATIVKNPAFQEEREWRLICLPLIFYDDDRGILPLGAPSPVKHISKPDALYPYLEFDFSTSTREVIHEIVLGPRNRTDINDMFIFLRNLGYTKCAPRRSCATYR